ncbi:hypothetical protein CVV68_18645 [Arthrobacter livingstonensis]|uniref:HNH nuclease domain-containing protein n=1 Tax=Arthrobacter livingstonensis TaxID=670078 RepID=A0A2V5L585_9MICC|nr:HNH endonuclease signature motif containing protein [Arthrobacter livingstonensis]PYI65324.1 hypothetical protein CVV68_18645 [Arthrobacter livingstonensis]
MEATARTPEHPGSTREVRGTGWHVRRLLALAESLTRSATAAASGSRAPGAGPASGAAAASDGADPSKTNSGTPADTGPAGPGPAGPGVGVPIGVDMDALSDAQAVTWAQDLEQLGCFLAALQVQAAGDLAGRVRASRYHGIKYPSELLAISLKLGRGEAGRRLRLASKFLPVTNPLTLVTTAPEQPTTAAAFFSGQLTADQALTASRYTEEARHLADAGRITGDTACEVEESLTGYARTMDPDSLARVGLRTVNTLDPDGQQPTEGELLAKQGITFRQPRRGLVHFEGWATVPQYETWMAGIASAANPRQHTNLNPDPAPENTTPETTASDSGDNAASGTAASDTAASDTAEATEAARGGEDPIPGLTDLDGLLITGHVRDADGEDSLGGPDSRDSHWETQSVAGQGVAGQGVAGQGVAGQGVAGQGVAGQGVAGQGVAGQGVAGQGVAGQGGDGPGNADWWPPPGQGPAPGWAREPSSTDSGQDPSGADSSQDPCGRETPAPWPHRVNGIQVPEPGSDEELPGLDPIDPACTNPVVADRRTRAQKLLDGTIEGIKLAARTGKLPMNGGLKPQLFISTTETELQRRTKCGQPGGIAFLPYSGPQPLALFSTELCDADVTTMILGNGQDILNVGRTQRLFTKAQRKILIARDKGCSFPHCTRTAMTTDAHHIIPWADGGETNISNAALLCEVHHHLVHDGAWSIKLIHGVPWFTPSYKIDPTRTKIRNTYHHGLPHT